MLEGLLSPLRNNLSLISTDNYKTQFKVDIIGQSFGSRSYANHGL